MAAPQMTPLFIVMLSLVGLLTSGCASRMVPFSNELRTEHNLSPEDIQSLQFYVSNSVKLRREVASDRRVIRGGQLKLHKGKTIEEIVIEKKTPGVAETITDSTISVSFEEGSTIDFSLKTPRTTAFLLKPNDNTRFAEEPDPFPGSAAPILAERSPAALLGNYFLTIEPEGTLVTFRSKLFEAVEDSYRAHLMIDAEALEDVVESHSVLGGRTL